MTEVHIVDLHLLKADNHFQEIGKDLFHLWGEITGHQNQAGTGHQVPKGKRMAHLKQNLCLPGKEIQKEEKWTRGRKENPVL